MSFTLTRNSERTATSATRIYLSPSKQDLLSGTDEQLRTRHSAKEIWQWTFKSEAVAECTVQDALQMEANKTDSYDFYWIGHVPCRSVKLVGMVVGIQEYERRIVYTIDDGTGVIGCTHTPTPLHKPAASTSKYEPLEKIEPPAPPKPIANIGQIVTVTGRIKESYERSVTLDTIATCSSPNDELIYALKVRELHRTLYSSTESFVIPFPTQLPTPPMPSPTKRVAFNNSVDVPSSPPSSISSSPVKAPSEYSSPIKLPKPTIKLRHPSRLHTHDLTANTFRIYVKHYVDRIQETQSSGYDSDASITDRISRMPSTPTKSSRSNNSETPRQSSRHDIHATPRPRIPALNFNTKVTNGADTSRSLATPPCSQNQNKQTTQKGFSLSYLRRVPELSLLASRVVDAVNRRHLRQEKKKLQAAGVQPPPSTQRSSGTTLSSTKLSSKMKRLFEWAIIQLLQEGCIVLWDGPVHSCPDTSMRTASQIWRSNTSTSTVGGDSTIFSTTLGSMPSFWGDDDDLSGALSDPDPDEEAYIALTPEYVADFVEHAINVLVAHYQTIGKPYAGATKDGILSVLRKDDRWRFLGTWTIDDALKELQLEGRVWNMGNGRWDLTE